jgi:dihydropteroate synthase
MIWARPLCRAADAAAAMWIRSGLTPEGVGLVRSGQESYALVTGLDDGSRELLAELVGAAWAGGSGDAAVLRYSRLSVENWFARLGLNELGVALSRLLLLDAPPAPTKVGSQRLEWGQRTRVMGIINVTPDSFSDGGAHVETNDAISFGLALLDAGADVLDVGGESTRPGAEAVSEAEEVRRVVPVIEGLRAQRSDALISVDTRKPGVARAAIAAGAQLVNDVSGLRDEAMLDVIAHAGVCACAMHMLGTPETMQREPRYDDVGSEILDSLELALRRAETRGIARDRLWVDPGIGFGKTAGHNLFLLGRTADLRLLGTPVLIGVSRKAFLGSLLGGKPPGERVGASAAAAAVLAADGAVDVVRVHDVAQTREALAVADAIRLARDGGARFGS